DAAVQPTSTDVVIISSAGVKEASFKLVAAANWWITDVGRDYLVSWSSASKQWQLIHPQSGVAADMPGVPELYSLTAPNGSSITIPSDFYSPWSLNFGQFQTSLGQVCQAAISIDG